MAAATASMETVVGATPAEADLPRLARSHITARARGWELTWRPWELARIPIRGVERIAEAQATGRGVMISKSHLGPLAGWMALGPLLRPLLLPADEWLLDEPNPGYDGYQVEHRRRILHDAGIELIYATGSAMALYKALAGGGAVLLSMDMPGGRRTQFLGKPVDMVDGTAQLAVKTDALVLPAALMPLGRRWEIQIGEALDPRDFSAPDELHLVLAAIHEELIMRAPEHLENPLWRWPGATRDGWYHP
jgi:lauroyl/myristoyl acyltransferase